MEKISRLSTKDAYYSTKEFFSKRNVIFHEISPTQLKGNHGHLLSRSRMNAKKKITINFEEDKDGCKITAKFSFLQEGIVQILVFFPIIFSLYVTIVVPIFFVMILAFIFTPLFLYMTYLRLGRGIFEKVFWQYIDYKEKVGIQ